MNDLLPIYVTQSLLFVILFSISLFAFIIVRRIITRRRDDRSKARYLEIEEDVLHAISTGSRRAALDVASKYASRRKILTQVLIDILEMIGGAGGEIVKAIFEQALRDRCLKDLRSRFTIRRLQAARLAGLLSAPPERALLLNLLKDKPAVRLAAVNALVQFPNPDSLALVFRSFEQESCPNIHSYTNIMFGAGDKVEPFVRKGLRELTSAEKLRILIELAGAVPLPSLYPEVVEHAGHPDKEVRIRVTKALSRFLIPESYEVLVKMAGAKEWEIQAQALKALGRLRNPAAVDILARALYSPVWHVRYNAREGLLGLGPAGIRRLQEVSRQSRDRFAADMAAMALEDAAAERGG